MNDYVTKVDQYPLRSIIAFNANQMVAGFLAFNRHIGRQRFNLTIGATGGNDHGVHHVSEFSHVDAGDVDGGGVDDSGGGFDLLTFCGFEDIDDHAVSKDQARIRLELRTFLTRFPGHALVQWGGNDATALGLREAESINALNLFRVWLEGQATQRKTNMKLGEAVEQLLGPGRMMPHRAFEDCVGTMIVLLAISD